jgi:CRISPR-associated endoribonuclease Cas6
MPLSAVIHLEATQDGRLENFTGRGVHGFWFQHWHNVDAGFADRLHAETQEAPFTLSPLMGLPHPKNGVIMLKAGQRTWMRITCLNEAMVAVFMDSWLANLPTESQIEIPQARQDGERTFPGVCWKVSGYALDAQSHALAAHATYQELARAHLVNSQPPRQWRLEFLTPTTFHAAKEIHLPFPLPDSLVASWLRRWQVYAPVALPQEVLEWARESLVISAYSLKTVPVREAERLRIGCVGTLTLRALTMPPYLRAVVDLLAAFALFAGSGSHTSQGMGQTRCVGTQ